MTNTKASTLLVATLVLSSGVCFSEAFSTITIKGRRRVGSSSLYYAPKDANNPGKRRRGRPRKATTSTAGATSRKGGKTRSRTTASAASDASLPSDANATRRRKALHKNNNNKKNKRTPPTSTAFVNSMLDHDLLSKEEERYLGTQVQKAAQMQDKMAEWLEDNRARILQQEEYQRLESIQELMYSEEDDDSNMDHRLYGSARSQAMEQHYLDEAQDDIFYPYGSAKLEEDDEDDMYGMTTDYTVFQLQPQQLQPSVPECWMDDILLNHPEDASSLLSLLTDEDIGQALNLQGGRSELRTILLEGALARERLIRANVKLVHSIAKKWVGDFPKQQGNSLVRVYSGASSSTITGRPTLDEALQEGILGLAQAAERFDPTRGFRFSTYATVWVTNSIRKCFQLESTSGLRLPVPYYDIKRKYVTRVRYYLDTQGHVPAMEVLADDLKVSVKRLVTILQLTQTLASLDSPLGGSSQGSAGAGKAGGVTGDDGGYTLATLLPSDEPQPEDHVERSLLRQCLENAMATELTPNERDVVRLRLGLDDGVPQTAKEVAAVFGGRFSEPAIRAMEQRAMNKLRSPFGVHTRQLMAYLDFAGIDGRNQLLR